MFEEVSGEDFTKEIRCNTSHKCEYLILEWHYQEPNGKGRGKGSKRWISYLDKTLSVVEAWHTLFSPTDISLLYACTTHRHKHTHTQAKKRKSFLGQSSLCLRLHALLFAVFVFRQTHTGVTASAPQ